jgi:hypothetical protein
MQIILRSTTGVVREGILAAASPHSLRVIMPGAKDALELTLVEGKWSFADGEAVEIEALIATDHSDAVRSAGYQRETRILKAGGAGA